MIALLTIALVVSAAAFDFPDPKNNGYNALQFKQCGPNKDFEVRGVDVSPMPLNLPGVFHTTIRGSLLREMKPPIKAKVSIDKFLLGSWHNVACIGDYGSCEYDLCALLAEQNAKGCPQEVLDLNLKCECPVAIGSVDLIKKKLDVARDVIPAGLVQFLNGDYRAQARVTSEGQEIACFEVAASLREKGKGGWLFG